MMALAQSCLSSTTSLQWICNSKATYMSHDDTHALLEQKIRDGRKRSLCGSHGKRRRTCICATEAGAQICALRTSIYQVAKFCQVICQTVGGMFLLFFQKTKYTKSIWQTLGDALRCLWSFSCASCLLTAFIW